MSDSGPPPESEQLMSTGDSVQADQSIKWDFLKQQTVTLTLNLNDILKNESQPMLNACDFSVSGRMTFTCKNCIEKESAVDQTSLVDSTPENVRGQDNNSAPQPPQYEQQEVCYSESQKVENSINKSQATLNEASDLLLKCSETLEKLKSELYASSENDDRNEKIKKVTDSEVKQTTVEVIKMLEDLGKDTGTIDSNDDDDEDNDGPGKQSEDPKGPTNPPNNPSKRDEASTGNHSTDSTEEHKDHDSTESELAETTTTEIDVNARLVVAQFDVEALASVKDESGHDEPSLPASEIDKKEGDSEETPNTGSNPHQQAKLPQESSVSAESVIEPKSDDNAGLDPQQGDGISHEPSPVEDPPISESPSVSRVDKQPEAGRPQESPVPAEPAIEEKPDDNTASLLDKEEFVQNEKQEEDESGKQAKEGEKSEEAPSTESNPQNEAELSQDSSILAVPVIEEPATSDKAANDGSENNVVAQPNVGEQVQSAGNVQPEGPQLTRRQIKKKAKNKKNTEKKKMDQANQASINPVVEREIDQNDVSMKVMLFAFFERMDTIRNNRTEPNDIKLPSLLKKISQFNRHNQGKQDDTRPEDVFEKLLGDNWEEKSDTRREICKELVYFAGLESFKSSARIMIAYIHHQYKYAGNSNQGSSNNLVTSVNDVYPMFVSEIHEWIDDHWVYRVLKYIRYRQRLEGQTQRYFWKIDLTKYNKDPRVLRRIRECKMQFEQNRSLENRLIFECYNYLISQQHRFTGVHGILDFDLDYISTRPEAIIRITELKFFKAVYGLKKDELERLIEEETKRVKELDKPEPENTEDTPSVPAELTPLSTTRSEEEVKRYRALCIIPHNLKLFLAVMKPITGAPPENLSQLLKDICEFHKKKDWDKDKKMTGDKLILKLFGPKEKRENMHEENQKFCRFFEEAIMPRHLCEAAYEMLEFMDNYITEQSIKEGIDRDSCAQSFLLNVNTDIRKWLPWQLETQLKNYVKQESCKKKFEEKDEYCWKPKPASYKMSPRLEERLVYHLNKPENFNSHIIAESYDILKHWSEESQILDEVLDFIFTRPEEMIKKAEEDFFLVLCPKPRIVY